MQAAESTWLMPTTNLRQNWENLDNDDTSGKQEHVSIRLGNLVEFLRYWYCSFIGEIFQVAVRKNGQKARAREWLSPKVVNSVNVTYCKFNVCYSDEPVTITQQNYLRHCTLWLEYSLNDHDYAELKQGQ